MKKEPERSSSKGGGKGPAYERKRERVSNKVERERGLSAFALSEKVWGGTTLRGGVISRKGEPLLRNLHRYDD